VYGRGGKKLVGLELKGEKVREKDFEGKKIMGGNHKKPQQQEHSRAKRESGFEARGGKGKSANREGIPEERREILPQRVIKATMN